MNHRRKRTFDIFPVRLLMAAGAAFLPMLLCQGLAHGFGFAISSDLFYWPTILIVAMWLGFWPGVVTTLVGVALIDFFIVPPRGAWIPTDPADVLALLVGAVVGTLMSWLASRYSESIRRVAVLEAEKRVQESENRFLKLLSESRDIVYRLNLHTGIYDFISPSAKTMLGYTEAEYSRMSADEVKALVHPDDVPGLMEGLELADRTGQAEIQYRVRAKDGSYRWVSNLVFVEYDEQGQPAFHEGNTRDITSTKVAEAALLRSEALASAGRMSAAIAHEINNPLTAVTNLLFLAGYTENLPESARGYLKQAEAELDRIGLIARRTLDFYRDTAEPAPVGVDDVLDGCLSLLRRQLERRKIQVLKDGDSGLTVTGFGGELRQVFTNLVVNALDALEPEGVLKIRARRSTRWNDGSPCIRIAVADNGMGIAGEVQPMIFEPFFTTKGKVGTGLGLWVSAQLIQKNGGSIRVRSSNRDRQRGTVFLIELPEDIPSSWHLPGE